MQLLNKIQEKTPMNHLSSGPEVLEEESQTEIQIQTDHLSQTEVETEVKVDENPMSKISMGTHQEDPLQEVQEEVMTQVQVDPAVPTIQTMIRPDSTLRFPEHLEKIHSDMPKRAHQVRIIQGVQTLIRTKSTTKSL